MHTEVFVWKEAMRRSFILLLQGFLFFSKFEVQSVQFSSVSQSCPILCDLMNRSTPGLPVHHQLPEFTQTHIHWVSDAIQPSHPSVVPFSSCLQSFLASGLFQRVSSSHRVARVLELQQHHQSFQWIFRTDFHYFALIPPTFIQFF